jgi:ribosome biogenesis GTPase
MDLLTPETAPSVDEIVELYRSIGYRVLCTSAVSGEGMDEFEAALKDATSVIAGPSGVGKSSLLNRVAPGLDIRTQTVSDKTSKGRHTTTHAALHPLPGGGRVVDTPGIREFGIVEVPADDLDVLFVEFQPFIDDCRYPNCTHDHEPGCAIRDAVEDGHLSEMRYESYLNILYSIQMGARDVGR